MGEEPEEEYAEKSPSDSEGEDREDGEGGIALPPKKRKAISENDVENKTAAAIDAKPVVTVAKLSQDDDKKESGAEEEAAKDENEKVEEPKEESETTKEAKEHGLSDENEAIAAMALPLEAVEDERTETE